MITGLVVFEDGRWRDLSPLTDLTPVPRLAFGASDLATRWQRAANVPILAIEARTGWAGGSTRLGEGQVGKAALASAHGGAHETHAAPRSEGGAASPYLPPPQPSGATLATRAGRA